MKVGRLARCGYSRIGWIPTSCLFYFCAVLSPTVIFSKRRVTRKPSLVSGLFQVAPLVLLRHAHALLSSVIKEVKIVMASSLLLLLIYIGDFQILSVCTIVKSFPDHQKGYLLLEFMLSYLTMDITEGHVNQEQYLSFIVPRWIMTTGYFVFSASTGCQT